MIDSLAVISVLTTSGVDCTERQKNIITKHPDLDELNVVVDTLVNLVDAQTISKQLDNLLTHPDLYSVEINLKALLHLSEEKITKSDIYLLPGEHLVTCVDAILHPSADWKTMVILHQMFELQEPEFLQNPFPFIEKIKLLNSNDKEILIKLLGGDLDRNTKVAMPEKKINACTPVPAKFHSKTNASFFSRNSGPTVLQKTVSETVNDVLKTLQIEDALNVEWNLIEDKVIENILKHTTLSDTAMTKGLIKHLGKAELAKIMEGNEIAMSLM